MMNLYVIGPVTGIENGNRPEFENARGMLIRAGNHVEIPHDTIVSGIEWMYAMAASIGRICDKLRWDGDDLGIAMLDGCEESKGAKIEHDLAVSLGIPCKPWRE